MLTRGELMRVETTSMEDKTLLTWLITMKLKRMMMILSILEELVQVTLHQHNKMKSLTTKLLRVKSTLKSGLWRLKELLISSRSTLELMLKSGEVI